MLCFPVRAPVRFKGSAGPADPSDMNSLSSDMLTFKNITEHKLSGSMFYHEEIDIFLPDMSSLSHDSSIGLLEFLGFPLGSLWEHFRDIWVSIDMSMCHYVDMSIHRFIDISRIAPRHQNI